MPVGTGTTTSIGAQVSLREYKDQVRVYLQDWKYEDRLQAAITDTSTTITVLDGTHFGANSIAWMGDEAVRVVSVSGNEVTIIRAWRGTQAAAHAAGVSVFKGVIWTNAQFADWVNESFAVMYPSLYQRTTATLTGSSTDYTYALPAAITERSQIEKVEMAYGTSLPITTLRGITLTGEPPELYIPADLSGYDLTLTYTYPFDTLTADNDCTNIPVKAKLLPVYYAAARAMEQREALRSRFDTYATVQNERTTREGQNIATGSYYFKLFNSLLDSVRMPRRGSI